MDTLYFKEQRCNPTGKFTEMMVRTYFLIYKACSDSDTNSCYDSQVGDRKICLDVYEGFYDDKPFNKVPNKFTYYTPIKKYLLKQMLSCTLRNSSLKTHLTISSKKALRIHLLKIDYIDTTWL